MLPWRLWGENICRLGPESEGQHDLNYKHLYLYPDFLHPTPQCGVVTVEISPVLLGNECDT